MSISCGHAEHRMCVGVAWSSATLALPDSTIFLLAAAQHDRANTSKRTQRSRKSTTINLSKLGGSKEARQERPTDPCRCAVGSLAPVPLLCLLLIALTHGLFCDSSECVHGVSWGPVGSMEVCRDQRSTGPCFRCEKSLVKAVSAVTFSRFLGNNNNNNKATNTGNAHTAEHQPDAAFWFWAAVALARDLRKSKKSPAASLLLVGC